MLKDKTILNLITIIIDIFLLYIMFNKDIETIDKIFIYVTFICHFIFYVALSLENSILLDLLHIFVFILPLFSMFIKNMYIKLVVILLLVCVQILWVIKGNCILNSLPTNLSNLNLGDYIEKLVILIIIILITQIFYSNLK